MLKKPCNLNVGNYYLYFYVFVLNWFQIHEQWTIKSHSSTHTTLTYINIETQLCQNPQKINARHLHIICTYWKSIEFLIFFKKNFSSINFFCFSIIIFSTCKKPWSSLFNLASITPNMNIIKLIVDHQNETIQVQFQPLTKDSWWC